MHERQAVLLAGQPLPSAAGRFKLPLRRLVCAVAAVAGAGLAGGSGRPARPDPDLPAQREICFPAAATTRPVKTFTGGGVVLWTDSPADGGAVVGQLRRVEEFLRSMFPGPKGASRPAGGPATRPVAVAIYDDPAAYRRLWRRVGDHYAGALPAVETEGYSFRVFCATSYQSPPAFARRQPVICHEFAHVWLYRHRTLRNDGNWLTEGIATAVQMKFFPASADRREFARWLEDGRMLPLKRLMDLDRIGTDDYWQAGTLAEVLMERHRESLPAVIEAYNAGRSAHAIITEVLGTDLPTLEKQWAAHVRGPAKAP